MAEKIFVTGISVKEGSEKTPWIKARFGISKKFFEFYEEHKDERGWLNFDLCESRDKTKLYVELNTWKAGQTQKKKISPLYYPDEENNDLGF